MGSAGFAYRERFARSWAAFGSYSAFRSRAPVTCGTRFGKPSRGCTTEWH